MRFSDVATLENRHVRHKDEEWHLRYRMEKTGARVGNLLPEPAVQILTRYYNPKQGEHALVLNALEGYDRSSAENEWMAIKSRNSLANRHLKRIAEKAGLDIELSFHHARHSLADHLRKEGWTLYDISNLLGHADTKVTERYLAGFDQDAINDQIDDLF